ncbi:hypothetical protein GCK72_023747 [Caenorhabditis remanei]|uniref:Uncharacterized protein n=1 Tax=Caenorhabditis remanei TaxID=31234 RepID=A0A6A5FXN2_CAERE|nr:hypothetical protein GCK72_023747 [Caenorhabditis remanei]KAF1747285.1 hypothetical protein GCK72_023747 [Caenorhabditis remanei]
MIPLLADFKLDNDILYMIPHALIGGLFLLSVFPRISEPLRLKFQISAHLVLSLLFFFAAPFFLKATIKGHFTNVHGFIQAFCASLHVGAGFFMWKTQKLGKPERSVIFSRLLSSLICLIFRLFAYMHISAKSAKGLELSNQGKGSFYIENAFYLDAGVTLVYAIIHISFPQHVLSLILKPDVKLDSHHYLWCRLYGALNLIPVITSMNARFYSPEMQTGYIASRLLSQCTVFMLNIYGHWLLMIYSPNHITAFMLSGFFTSFLFSAFHRIHKNYYGTEVEEEIYEDVVESDKKTD